MSGRAAPAARLAAGADVTESIFLQFHLPNAATWFYLSVFLAVALFFQFGRAFSLRNWDLLAFYLFVPGFLLVQEAHELDAVAPSRAGRERVLGYVWLLAASGYWLLRSAIDLAVVRRPAYRSNLSSGGLAWFGAALFVGLASVAVRRPAEPTEPVGKPPAAINGVKEGATAVVAQAAPPADAASAAEVRSWVERTLAMVGHLAVVFGLVMIGWRHFREPDTGFAMGTLYLLLPYTAYHIAQLHHVLPAALTVWAVFAYRHPRTAGWLLGLAAGGAFFPVVLFPVWLHLYRGRGAWPFASRFLFAAGLGLGGTLLVLWAAGRLAGGVGPVLNPGDWQPWVKPTTESVWEGVHWAYRLPVFIAYAVLLVTVFFWPAVRTAGHAVALSAVALIGVQFWYADRGGLYVLWYAPLLILMVFRPTAADLEPPAAAPRPGWGEWLVAAAWHTVRRRPAQPQPPALAA
jgi:hypothetical protein